ncbi:hypothetical protein Tco_0011979 [Tanacetum coccineum]
MKINYAYPDDINIRLFNDMNQYNILEDIKRGPYSKKSPIRRDLDNSTNNVQLSIGYLKERTTSGIDCMALSVLQFAVKMDDPNITIEEYIRLEEEKARRRAIVFNDTLTSEAALSCEPTVSSLNNDEIDFRISFDESDDEDCTSAAISLPLVGSDHGTILHVFVQLLTAKTGFREFEQQRDKGLQNGNNVDKVTEPNTA